MAGDAHDRPRQLTLDLALPPDYRADQFEVGGSNQIAHRLISLWPDWPDAALLLTGPAGSGKTHLLHIWAQIARAPIVAGAALAQADVARLAHGRAVAVDEAETAAQAAESVLFHLFNMMRETGGALMLASRRRPEAWGLATPDLLSRLRLATRVGIAAPDEALLRRVIAKLFRDRQLVVEPEIMDYVALRLPRSLAAARSLVAGLDAAALERGARITRALAARAIEELETGEEAE